MSRIKKYSMKKQQNTNIYIYIYKLYTKYEIAMRNSPVCYRIKYVYEDA